VPRKTSQPSRAGNHFKQALGEEWANFNDIADVEAPLFLFYWYETPKIA